MQFFCRNIITILNYLNFNIQFQLELLLNIIKYHGSINKDKCYLKSERSIKVIEDVEFIRVHLSTSYAEACTWLTSTT